MRFNIGEIPGKPHRFARIVVSIEEIDEKGQLDPLAKDAIGVLLKKDLELFTDDGCLFARQKQGFVTQGEERIDEGKFLGVSGTDSAKEAVWEYVALRLGIKS